MRQFSKECGAENPISLRGTLLRKHIATKCVSLKLSENQVSNLADHLGHAKEIHKKYYQKPLPGMDIVNVVKLLEVASGQVDEDESDDSETETETNENRLKGEYNTFIFT